VEYWLKRSQPSDTVYNMMVADKIVEGKKKVVPMPKNLKMPRPKLRQEPRNKIFFSLLLGISQVDNGFWGV